MTATPTDPAAIDLRGIRACQSAMKGSLAKDDIDRLIAAVEALRERLKDVEESSKYWMNNATAASDGAGARITWKDRVEATEAREAALSTAMAQSSQHTEARVAELAGALGGLLGRLDSHFGGPLRNMDWKEQENARAALSATPAKTLERARAVAGVVQLAKDGLETGFGAEAQRALDMAIARLEQPTKAPAKADAGGEEG